MPELEEREAATFAHVPWTQYDVLDNHDKARIVGHYRMHAIIEAHTAEASRRHSELMNKTTER